MTSTTDEKQNEKKNAIPIRLHMCTRKIRVASNGECVGVFASESQAARKYWMLYGLPFVGRSNDADAIDEVEHLHTHNMPYRIHAAHTFICLSVYLYHRTKRIKEILLFYFACVFVFAVYAVCWTDMCECVRARERGRATLKYIVHCIIL